MDKSIEIGTALRFPTWLHTYIVKIGTGQISMWLALMLQQVTIQFIFFDSFVCMCFFFKKLSVFLSLIIFLVFVSCRVDTKNLVYSAACRRVPFYSHGSRIVYVIPTPRCQVRLERAILLNTPTRTNFNRTINHALGTTRI